MSEVTTEEKTKKPTMEPISIVLPPNVAVDKVVKAQIINGAKAAITLLQANNLIESSWDFDGILDEPQKLKTLFNVFRENIDLFAETVVDKAGDPIVDETTETKCGVTLQQVQKLLIATSARRFFVRNDGKIVEKKQKKKIKSMVFFTKEITVTKKVRLKEGEKKFEALRRVIGFDWQLDMLEFYRDRFPFSHLLVLGDDILAIQNEIHGDEVVAVHHEEFKKVKAVTGAYFRNVIAGGATAIPGILYWRKDLIPTFIKSMGLKAWDFFRRDKRFFDHCTELDIPRISIYGETLAYIAAENLTEMGRLNLDRLDATIQAMQATFGDKIVDVLSEPLLSVQVLRPMVDSFIHLEAKDNEQFSTACKTAVHTLKTEILTFITEAKAKHEEEAKKQDEDEDED
jgi:hypothetical protein